MGETNISTRTDHDDREISNEIVLQDHATYISNDKMYCEFSDVSMTISAISNPENIPTNKIPLDQEITLRLGLSDTNLLSIIERKIYRLVDETEFQVTLSFNAERSEYHECTDESDCTNTDSETINSRSLTLGDESRACQDTEISPNSNALVHYEKPHVLQLQVQILSLTSASSIVKTSTEEKLDRALTYKELGTSLYKTGNIELAFAKYKRALQYLILIGKSIATDVPSRADEYRALKVQCHLNMAACQGAHQAWHHVIANCTKAVELESTSVKALYRFVSHLRSVFLFFD